MSSENVGAALVALNAFAVLMTWAMCPWPLGGWTEDDVWNTERW